MMVVFNKESNTRDVAACASRESLLAQILEMASTLFYRPILRDQSKCDQTSCAEKHVLLAHLVNLGQ